MEIGKLVGFMVSRYGTANPFLLAEKLNIDLRWLEMPNDVLGKTQYFFDCPVILMNNAIKDSVRRYFVISHELGHVVLHEGLAGYYNVSYRGDSRSEYEADTFARELLLYTFQEDFGELPESVAQLQNYYGFESED